MRNTVRLITLASLLSLWALPLSAAAYLKFDTIKGDATAAGHEKWIELESFQIIERPGSPTVAAADAPMCRKAKTTEAVTNVKKIYDGARSTETPWNEQLVRLCQTGAPQSSVILDVDGERHVLRNVSLRGCHSTPVGDSTRLAFTMSFSECTSHAEPTTSERAVRADATLTGLPGSTGPVEAQLERLTIGPTQATLSFRHLGIFKISAAPRDNNIESLLVELKTGTKWIFYDAAITSVQPSSTNPQGSTIVLNFARVDGPSAGFPQTR